jgi:hypothetical protein
MAENFSELGRLAEVSFYLPLMDYEGSIGLVTGEIKKIYC